ncbi:MAG: ABC transporter ATP-binding protein [Negativicutes bacterium]|nr:ABC transporter ATP-binding protein [Negativicutes bacterium]MDR3592816.1 ABC transporter ATP-binding protein [Negativicutes bacterium]
MLQAKDLKLGYKGTPAIHGITFGVNAGEVIAVVGANGAGKSTILRGISGVIPPLGGEIEFCGQRLNGMPAHKIVSLGIAHVPEGRLTFARMTVEQNLLLGAYTVKSEAEATGRLEEMYDLFPRLKERRTQLAGTMSGGEQQMLVIARGLMSDPKLLMLDEPSLGIAPKVVMQIFDFLRQVKATGKTILLVEQNVREALELADRAYVLQTGRIVAEGSGEELLGSDLVRKAYLGL